MSIDIDQIKNKLDKLQKENNSNGGGSGDGVLWKPSDGEQKVRIVPYKNNPSNPFIEMYTYFNFGGETFVSPMSYGDPDPIYEFSQELRKQNSEDSYEKSKKFEPSMRTYVPIIVRGKEDEGIKYWGFGKKAYEQLLGYIADPEWGDITDPKTGRDIKIIYDVPEGWPKNKSNGFPETTIRPSPKQTPVMEDVDKFKEMLNKQPDIKKIFKPLSYEELETKLNDYIGNNDSSDEQSAPKSNSKSEDNTPWADSSDEDKSSVEDAFDDLFDD